jgi:two-component sensor histidine kinase
VGAENVWIGFRWFKDRLGGAFLAVSDRLHALTSFRGSLRAHLFVFAFALVLPLFFLIGLALYSIVSSEIAQTRGRLQRTAQDISRSIEREIFGHLTTLQTLATTQTLERGDYLEFHKRAKAALGDRKASVLLLDPTLQQLLNTRVPYGTALPKTSDEAGARQVFNTGKSHISDVFMGKVSKRQVVNVEYPVIRDGVVKYVLLIAIEVESFIDSLSGLQTAEGLVVTLSDRNGAVIASAPPGNNIIMAPASERPVPGSAATFEYRDASGASWVEATAISELSGWRTSVVAPAALFTDLIWTSLRWFLYALAATVLLIVMLGTMIGRRLAEPIHEIRFATNELAEGELVERRDLPLKEARSVMRSLSRASELIASRTASLKESEEQSREHARQINTLMHELAHRNKNQLSIVLAMARQLAGSSKDLSEFQEKFAQRIMAKAAAQDLVSRGVAAGVPLDLLLENQMKPFAGEKSPQVSAAGPEVLLTAEAARTIGMAFHELATNATKYGALSKLRGRINVTWSVDQPSRKLRIEWRETDGPEVKAPERLGFGHTIVDKYISRMLNAEVSYRFDPEGVVWTVEAEGLLV